MHILSLAKPPSENEVVEMQTINQENIPEVGDLSELEDFRARVNWSKNIFVYKWEDIIKAFVLCMREGQAYNSPNYQYISNRFKQFLYVDRIAVQEKFRRKGIAKIEATQEAENKWVQTIIEKARITADFQEKCTPGYYNNEGKINQKPQNGMYGGGPIEFFAVMKKWRSKGSLEGLELTKQ